MIVVTGGTQGGGKRAALREAARRWLEQHPGATVWFTGQHFAGRRVREGWGPAAGWRLEKMMHRDAYLAFPAWVWWIRRAWAARWAPVAWGLRVGILEGKDGALFTSSRPRGWCALTGHRHRLELEYRGRGQSCRMPTWASMRAWRALAVREFGGRVVLTHARQWCDGCGIHRDYELVPAIVVKVPLPEPELDSCALEGWLPELHAPPIP